MSANALETVGDQGRLFSGNTGTLSLGGVACGTLTAGTLSGVFGDGFLAATIATEMTGIYDITPNKIDVPEVKTTKLVAKAQTSQPSSCPDYGEVKVTVAYSSSNTTTITALIDAGTVQFWKMTVDDFATDSSNGFLGWVKDFTPLGKEFKKDQTQMAELTLKITGKSQYVAGS